MADLKDFLYDTEDLVNDAEDIYLKDLGRFMDPVEEPVSKPISTDTYSFNWEEHPKALPYRDVIEEAEKKYNLPKNMLPNVILTESNFELDAMSPKGAQGIMQILPSAHPGIDPFDYKSAIDYGAGLYRQYYDKYGSWDKAKAAYNMGEGNLEKYGERGLEETSNYIDKINEAQVPEVQPPAPEPEPKVGTGVTGTWKEDVPIFNVPMYMGARVGLVKPVLTETGLPGTPRPIRHGVTGTWGEEISTRRDDDNFVKRAFNKLTDLLGSDVEPRLSDEARAAAVVELMANEEGIPLSQYRESPEFIEKTASAFVDSATFGLVPTLRETLRGETDFVATDIPGYVGSGLGHLAGFLFGPVTAARKLTSPVRRIVPMATKDAHVAARLFLTSLHDATILGVAGGLAQLGPAAKSVTFTQASEQLWEGAKSGALTGVIFGATKGMFPGDGAQKAARMVTGLIGLNAQRAMEVGGNPFTNRPIGSVVFDTLMDAVFLWNGLPRADFNEALKGIDNLSKQAVDTGIAKDAAKTTLDESVKDALDKIAEAKKKQFELSYNEFIRKLGGDVDIMEELMIQDEREAKARLRPTAYTGLKAPSPAQVRAVMERLPEGKMPDYMFTSRKGKTYMKVGDTWYDDNRVPVTNKSIIEAAEAKKTKPGEEAPEYVPPERKVERPYAEVKSEAQEVFDALDMPEQARDKLRRKKKIRVIEHDVAPGENVRIPATWHDAVFRYTAMRTPEGDLIPGEAGSYDTIMMPGRVAGAKEGPFPPGHTLYIFDTGGTGTVAETNTLRIYRMRPAEPTKVEQPKIDYFGEGEESVIWDDVAMKQELARIKAIEDYFGKEISEISNEELETFFTGEEPEPELDEIVGNSVSDDKFFITDPKLTEQRRILYSDPYQIRSMADNPEKLKQKLLNDMNRWYHGDDSIDVEATRNELTRLHAEADDYLHKYTSDGEPYFIRTEDHLIFKESASQAAKWARNLDRPKIKPSGGGVQLNAMIPMNELPDAVRGFLMNVKKLLNEDKVLRAGENIIFTTPDDLYAARTSALYRNKELFDATGFWLGRDGMWRYELDDSKANINTERLFATEGSVENNYQGTPRPLPEIYEHPDLYKAVPQMKDVSIIYDNTIKMSEGSYSPSTRLIRVGSSDKSLLGHELQHAINDIVESSFLGSSPSTERTRAEMRVVLERLKELVDYAKTPEVKQQAIATINGLTKSLDAGDVGPGHLSMFYQIIKGYHNKGILSTEHKNALLRPVDLGKPFEAYRLDPGEMESRVASERIYMDPNIRKRIPPWESLDSMLEKEGYDVKAGEKLYAGIPADEAVKALKKVVKYVRGKLIKSVNSSESEILKDIVALHTGGKIDADITYSKGAMWKNTGIAPKYKFDLRQEAEDIVVADVGKYIPLKDSSINSVMFDPPFLVHTTGKGVGMMGERFTTFKSVNDLWKFYKDAIGESYRVLAPGGKLIVKSQDLSQHKALVASSSEVYNFAIASGFKPIDRFIYEAKRHLPLPARTTKQATSKKVHRDFWVFEKPKRSFTYPSEGGVKLYAGIDPKEVSKLYKTIKDKVNKSGIGSVSDEERAMFRAGEWNEAFEEARKAKRFNVYRFLDRVGLHTGRAIHERRMRLRNEIVKKYGADGYKILQYIDAGDAADGRAERMEFEMRREAFKDVPRNLTVHVDAVDLINRLKDIYGYKTTSEFVPPKGMGPEQTAAIGSLIGVYRGMTPEEIAIAEKASKVMSDHVRLWVDDLVRVGLKSKEEGDKLKSHDYRKVRSFRVENMFDSRYRVRVGDKLVRQSDSGVDYLGKNAINMIETDSRILYKETADRIYRRVSNQETKLAWKEFDEKHPENPFVIFQDNDTAAGRSKRKIPRGWVRDFWFEDGKRKTMYYHPDVALQLLSSGSHISFPLTRILTNVLGVNLTRSLAVGLSPIWATTRGITMDIGHTFFSARTFDEKTGKYRRVYSRFSPKFLGQIGRDMANTFHDVVSRGEKTGVYEKSGGTMPFLAMRESHFTSRGIKPPGKWSKFLDGVSFWGQSMERWNRVAVMERNLRQLAMEAGISLEEAYKDKDMVMKAVHSAVERLPYRQGGWLVKELDKVFGPFISASYNAGRTFLRGAKENKVDFWVRVANVAIPSVGATIATILYAPEAKRDTPEWQYTGGPVFPFFPDSLNFIDEEGNKRYINVRLPTDPIIAAFYNVFRGLTEKMLYETGYTNIEPNYQAIIDSIKRSLPIDQPLAPFVNAYLAYFQNLDTWKNEKVVDEAYDWPKSGMEGQRDERVSKLARDIGKKTGISAPRLEAAGRQFGIQSNEFTWALGQIYDLATNDVDPRLRRQHWAMVIAKTPGLRNLMSVTVPRAYRIKDRHDMKQDESFNNMLIREELDYKAEGYYWKGVGNEADIDAYIDSFEEKHIRDRLEKKRLFIENIKDLKHRTSWSSVFHTSPEYKAEDYYKIWKIESSPEERLALERELDELLVAGYISKESEGRFWETLDSLMYPQETVSSQLSLP